MKRYLCIGLILLLCLGLVACDQIEDTNGEEDPSLAVLTEQDLLKGYNSSVMVGFISTKINDKLTCKANQFSGVKELESIRATNGTQSLTFDVQSTLGSGNLRIYVRSDGRIVGDFEVGKRDTLTIEQPAPGEYELCIAGESASFEITATIQKQ